MRLTGLVAAVLMLTACGGGDGEPPSTQADVTATTSAAAVTSAARATPSPAADSYAKAVELCTEGLAGPDGQISDAMHAAHDGTRSVSEVADAFREAQDDVEGLAAQAEAGNYPRLAQALQVYADTLGRARVSGAAALDDITATREAINLACYTPDAPAT